MPGNFFFFLARASGSFQGGIFFCWISDAVERSHFPQHPRLLAELSLVGKGELRASPWPTITPHLVSSLSAVLWDSTFHESVHLIILVSLKR